jgi:hypothetical protein
MRRRTTATFIARDNNNSFVVAFHSTAHRHALKTTTALSALIDDTTTTSSTNNSLYFDPSTVVTPGVFEPVLNIEATVSFTIIAIIFALLQYRINAVTNAATRRSSALVELRQAESLQLSNPTNDTNVVITRAKNEYEIALRQELRLRTILPGVRIAAPNDAARSEEDRAAAKRFLGWKNEDFGYDLDAPTIDEKAGSNRDGNNNNIAPVEEEEEEGKNGLSSGSKLILAGVASMLIVLLWTLSFDPMTGATSTDINVFG